MRINLPPPPLPLYRHQQSISHAHLRSSKIPGKHRLKLLHVAALWPAGSPAHVLGSPPSPLKPRFSAHARARLSRWNSLRTPWKGRDSCIMTHCHCVSEAGPPGTRARPLISPSQGFEKWINLGTTPFSPLSPTSQCEPFWTVVLTPTSASTGASHMREAHRDRGLG